MEHLPIKIKCRSCDNELEATIKLDILHLVIEVATCTHCECGDCDINYRQGYRDGEYANNRRRS